jgi:hypothetical protein
VYRVFANRDQHQQEKNEADQGEEAMKILGHM